MKIYYEVVTRPYSLLDIRAWYEGESEELKKRIGFGFYNTIFVSNNGNVTVYYDKEECNKWDEILEKNLTEDLFHELCNEFFALIRESAEIESEIKLFEIMIKSWPAQTIFDEISKYPEYANDNMLIRLVRVRKTTESFSYELSKKLNHPPEPEAYIFYKGDILTIPFNQFLQQNNFILKEHE